MTTAHAIAIEFLFFGLVMFFVNYSLRRINIKTDDIEGRMNSFLGKACIVISILIFVYASVR